MALVDVVRSFARAIRAMGYYDAGHPVFESTRREAHAALDVAFSTEQRVTLGSAGRHLYVDEDGPALEDPPSRTIAERMFDRSIVAIRLDPSLDERSLSALMQALAEAEDRLRHAGGVGALLDRDDVRGVHVVEIDFAQLFAADTADLSPMVGDDPVARRALEEVLRFDGKKEDAAGDALALSIEQVATVESLGSFLDDLLDSGESGVVKGSDGAGGPFGLISGDDLADYAAQAYMKNQAAVRQRGADANEIGESANLLADALVRLAPDARFALLRRLAGADEPQSPEQEAATSALAGRLDDRFIVQTMASALLDRRGDADAVRAIGNVLRRLRPVEAERRRLLEGVDHTLSKNGRALDGVLWQEMQSRAFDDKTLGMLEMAIAASKDELERYATARMKEQLPAVPGQDILFAAGGGVEEFWTAGTLLQMLQEPGMTSEGFVGRCEDMINALDKSGATEEALDFLQALMTRADDGDAREIKIAVRRMLEGDNGRRWSMQLLERRGVTTTMMGEVLLAALDGTTDRAAQEALIARLGDLTPAAFYELTAERIGSVDPLRVQQILRAAMRSSPSMAVKLARIAIKNGAVRSKEVAMKTLTESKDRDAIAVLAHLAGWKGDKQVLSLLGVSTADEKRFVHKLQLVAVGALGMTRSPLAVRPLEDLIVTAPLMESKAHEEIRVGAAQALRTNGTPRAKETIAALRKHKKRSVRDIVERVLTGRPSAN